MPTVTTIAIARGAVEPIDFISFADIEARFQRDWLALKDAI